jgi:hypothetical protein
VKLTRRPETLYSRTPANATVGAGAYEVGPRPFSLLKDEDDPPFGFWIAPRPVPHPIQYVLKEGILEEKGRDDEKEEPCEGVLGAWR